MSGAVPLLGAGGDDLACALCGVMVRCAHRVFTVLHSVTDCATPCCREGPELKAVAFEFLSCLLCVVCRYCWTKLSFKKVSAHEVVVIWTDVLLNYFC